MPLTAIYLPIWYMASRHYTYITWFRRWHTRILAPRWHGSPGALCHPIPKATWNVITKRVNITNYTNEIFYLFLVINFLVAFFRSVHIIKVSHCLNKRSTFIFETAWHFASANRLKFSHIDFQTDSDWIFKINEICISNRKPTNAMTNRIYE